MTATVQTRRAPAPVSQGTRRRIDWSQPFVYLIALAVAGVAVGPVLYVAVAGMRTNPDFFTNPGGWPNPWTLDNYVRVFGSEQFWRQVIASTITALGTTLGVMLAGVMAAFAIARYEFRGRNAMFSLFAAGLMFPLTVAITPLYILIRTLGLTNSLAGIILPQIAFALPMTVIILVPFLRAIPKEIEEAAAIDGSGRVGFFFRMVLPLSMPGVMTTGILAFIGAWNNYMLPLFILSDPDKYTLPLGVQAFASQHSVDTAAVLAFTSLSMLPALLFFSIFERRIVGGLTGAVKG